VLEIYPFKLESFRSIVCFEVEMGLGCHFGMIIGVGNNLLNFNSQIFSGWHV